MKSWFKKFHISADLDVTRIPARAKKSVVSGPAELGEFENDLHQLDLELKNSLPTDSAPANLHASIMRRIRNVADARQTRSAPPAIAWRWLIAPGVAVVVVLGLWLGTPEKKSAFPPAVSGNTVRTLMAAASTFEMTRSAVQTAPASALDPLESEMALLRSDARQALDLVLAALPQDAVAFAWPERSK